MAPVSYHTLRRRTPRGQLRRGRIFAPSRDALCYGRARMSRPVELHGKRRRHSAGPRPGGSLLDTVFVRTRMQKVARDYRALWAWHRVTGERFGGRTRAE